MKSNFLTSAALVGLIICPPALAQSSAAASGADAQAGASQDPAVVPGEEAAQTGGLEDIIVTAQRREENLQRAAVAVTAVSAADLVNANVTNPQGLTSLVPALQVANAAGPYALFYLRGVGNFNGNGLSDSAIAVNLDGVFLARPSGTSGLFYDVERIEVLKGPQGTLYGRNATGGAINVITRRPELGETSGELVASYGNYDAVQLNGALNLPLTDNTAIRIAAQRVKRDGYMTDGSSDQDDWAARIQLRWEPTDRLTIQIGGDYFDQGGRGIGSTVLTDANPNRLVGLGDPASAPAFRSVYFFPAGNTLRPVPNDTFLNNEFWGAYTSINLETDFADFTAIGSYRKSSLDFRSTAPSFLINQREKDKQLSLELRLASNDTGSAFQWLIGGYYFKENIDVPGASFNQQVAASFQQFSPDTQSLAFFGRVTASLSDTFRLVGGARYTTEDKDFNGSFTQLTLLCGGTALRAPTAPVANCFGAPLLPNTPIPGPVFSPTGSTIPFQPFGNGSPFPGGPATTPTFLSANTFSINRSLSFNRFTYRLGFEWDVFDQSLLYGTYETGFKSGGFFFTRDNPIYRPETIEAWTLGMKNRFFDNRLQLNAELFWWKYKDQQVSSSTRDSFNNVIFATRNVGRSTNRGFEVEALALVTPTTQVSANVQYLDAVYDSFSFTTPNNSPQVPALITSVPPTANCPFTLGSPPTVYVQDCSGRRPPNAPEWVFALGVDQTIPLGDYKIVINGRTRYQSQIFTGLEYLRPQLQGSYWQSDASVTFTDEQERYFLTGFINNIEDNVVIGNSFPNPFGGSALVAGSVRPPRTYGVRAGVKF